MKKLFGLVALIGLLALPAAAQTNTTETFWDFATTGSNYFVIPYGTMSTGDKTFGGGIALGYHIPDNEWIVPVFRGEYFDHSIWTLTMTVTLQPPRRLFGAVPLVPFASVGGGGSMGGQGENNGRFVSMVGGGAVLHFDTPLFGSGTSWFAKHAFLVGAYEHWDPMPAGKADHIMLGLGASF